MDADGQHLPEDAAREAMAHADNADALVLGCGEQLYVDALEVGTLFNP